mmetsp:Transcript_4559/g.5245  ORF Transcript_4559/g.5245 Transcript_4559/m.5245 type:complete len:116 (+) Transcript_4559:76-423(+)
MPTFIVDTNVKLEDTQIQFLSTKLTDLVIEVLGKPKSYIAVKISPGLNITWGGTTDPCALCNLISLGQINKENNTKVSEKLAEILKEILDIESNRYYINFFDMERENVGYNGTVF